LLWLQCRAYQLCCPDILIKATQDGRNVEVSDSSGSFVAKTAAAVGRALIAKDHLSGDLESRCRRLAFALVSTQNAAQSQVTRAVKGTISNGKVYPRGVKAVTAAGQAQEGGHTAARSCGELYRLDARGGGGIAGTLTTNSLSLVLVAMKEKQGFCSSSRLVDLGHGRGQFLRQACLDVPGAFVAGIEKDEAAFEVIIRRALMRCSLLALPTRTATHQQPPPLSPPAAPAPPPTGVKDRVRAQLQLSPGGS
jgi:hypothetical protein